MSELSRRGFLFLCGAAASGLWLAQVGLIALPQRMVLALGGLCSFCGRSGRNVGRLAGVMGRNVRICEQCVGLCLDIIAEEIEKERLPPVAPPRAPRIATPLPPEVEELQSLLSRSGTEMTAPDRVERIQRLLDGPSLARPERLPDFLCSFCDAPRREVVKLISGPRVFICDGCVADATVLWPDLLGRPPGARKPGRRVIIFSDA